MAAIDMEATDRSRERIAIKKVEGVWRHRIFAKRVLRELRLLRMMKHENIINIETIIQPESREKFNDVYVVTELMDTDLAQIISSKQSTLN